jgi:hypothetical protein
LPNTLAPSQGNFASIHQLDHLRALGQAGHDRRRNQIAAESGDAVLCCRAFGFQQCHKLRESALSTFCRDLIDVVGVQEGNLRRLGRCREGQREDKGASDRPRRKPF